VQIAALLRYKSNKPIEGPEGSWILRGMTRYCTIWSTVTHSNWDTGALQICVNLFYLILIPIRCYDRRRNHPAWAHCNKCKRHCQVEDSAFALWCNFSDVRLPICERSLEDAVPGVNTYFECICWKMP
jgi:hypothetical protein